MEGKGDARSFESYLTDRAIPAGSRACSYFSEAEGSKEREETMAVPQDLLDILVCPVDKTPVKLTSDQKGLKCSTCRRVYPIREDIPSMLVDEAKIDPA